jgi:hypothetical protein
MADAVFAQLVMQIAELAPALLSFADLGDVAARGTSARHEGYLRLVEPLPMPISASSATTSSTTKASLRQGDSNGVFT